jgi:hypothetical protein
MYDHYNKGTPGRAVGARFVFCAPSDSSVSLW